MTTEQKKEAAFTFMREHPSLTINGLSKECKVPYTSLYHAYKYNNPLSDKHIDALYDRLKHYGLK